MTPILEADCIAKSFGDRCVLSAASLRAVPGQLRVLFGRNGIGKSTLLKVAAGCLTPDSGTIRFAGKTYVSARLARLAADGLFYWPDHNLFSAAFSIRRQLQMVHAQFGGASVIEAAERMRVVEHLDKRPFELSQGERRRAELAAVIVRRPTCLLADEPYRGIMPKDAEDMTLALRRFAHDGMAVLATGHDVPSLLGAADHVSWCTSGTTHELGPPGVAVAHFEFRRDYLGQLTETV